MLEFLRKYTLFVAIGLFFIKYTIQLYYYYSNRNQKVIFREKPFVGSEIIWLISLIVFLLLIFNRHAIKNNIISLSILLIGIIIGILGLIRLNKNFHDNLVKYDNGYLVKNGIYGIIRHPIRLGICFEVLAMVVLINSFYLVPLYLLFIYLNIKRTEKEEKFLISIYKEEAIQYYSMVPQFNIIKGFYLKIKQLMHNFNNSRFHKNL
jgi:protein-S-isoprenylcysteine O-methyltransferase Ste14